MIGPRVGLACGLRVGLAAGISQDSVRAGGLVGVTQDAASLIYCPASAAEWTLALAAAGDAVGGPGALHLCQEASGNLADSIGAFPLTASGNGITYRQAVTGWSRLGITFADGGTGAFGSTDAALPDISTTSCALLLYLGVTAPASNRDVAGFGTTTKVEALLQTTSVPRLLSGANSAVGASNATGAIRPWIICHNKTASSDVLYTDQEKVTPTFSALTTGKQIVIGQLSTPHLPGQALYAAWFFGAAAERSSTQWKTLLTTLGFSPAFS